MMGNGENEPDRDEERRYGAPMKHHIIYECPICKDAMQWPDNRTPPTCIGDGPNGQVHSELVMAAVKP